MRTRTGRVSLFSRFFFGGPDSSENISARMREAERTYEYVNSRLQTKKALVCSGKVGLGVGMELQNGSSAPRRRVAVYGLRGTLRLGDRANLWWGRTSQRLSSEWLKARQTRHPPRNSGDKPNGKQNMSYFELLSSSSELFLRPRPL